MTRSGIGYISSFPAKVYDEAVGTATSTPWDADYADFKGDNADPKAEAARYVLRV
jgi:hypothetical protein